MPVRRVRRLDRRSAAGPRRREEAFGSCRGLSRPGTAEEGGGPPTQEDGSDQLADRRSIHGLLLGGTAGKDGLPVVLGTDVATPACAPGPEAPSPLRTYPAQ